MTYMPFNWVNIQHSYREMIMKRCDQNFDLRGYSLTVGFLCSNTLPFLGQWRQRWTPYHSSLSLLLEFVWFYFFLWLLPWSFGEEKRQKHHQVRLKVFLDLRNQLTNTVFWIEHTHTHDPYDLNDNIQPWSSLSQRGQGSLAVTYALFNKHALCPHIKHASGKHRARARRRLFDPRSFLPCMVCLLAHLLSLVFSTTHALRFLVWDTVASVHWIHI